MFISLFPRMVQEYYVERLRKIMDDRHDRIASLKNKSEAEKYVKYVRNSVYKSFGPFPAKTPLNPVISGRDEYKEYFLEKIKIESRPGFFVTGNMYIPKNLKAKAPGVLGLCGHSPEGKAEKAYQSFCQGLVLKGFVVFIIDPISQGERWQHEKQPGLPLPRLCHAHNLMGHQLILTGDFFGSWRVWDAIRGLDYLLTRSEVDKSCVGVTGNSGGGTLTSYLTALDPRLTMAAPSCYICSWLANMENELPADAEQNPPGLLADGLDEADLLLCYAPRPTIILAQYNDFFDERYARMAYEDVKKVHKLLGSPDSAEYFAGPTNHGYHIENREAMYKFFLKRAGIKKVAKEPLIDEQAPKKLYVFTNGRVNYSGSKPVGEFIKEKTRELKKNRKKLDKKSLIKTSIQLLEIPAQRKVPHFRCLYNLRNIINTKYKNVKILSQFGIETEPGIQAIVSTFGPEHPHMHLPKGEVILYLGNVDPIDDISKISELRNLIKGRKPLLAVSPRGVGMSQPATCGDCGDFFRPYGSDFMYAGAGEMLNENYLGRRVFDVLMTMDLMYNQGTTKINLIGRGMGSVIASFAALLHESEVKVKIFNYLPSYQMIIDSQVYQWPLSTMVRDVLKYFDLPDVYNCLGTRLTKAKPWSEFMK